MSQPEVAITGVGESCPIGRAREIFVQHLRAIWEHTDRLFASLMIVQWIGGIVLALTVSPRAWAGARYETHIHVWTAIFLLAAISGLPVYLALRRPGWVVTRHVVAAGQMLTSAVLIHLTGGRIETHFHVYGSLAFLSFYRDWPVLITGSVVVAIDHLFRGAFWPQSVFGVFAASPWRSLEHAAWVVFTDIFLILSIVRSRREMLAIAVRQANLEGTKSLIEREVEARTAELKVSEERFRLATAAVNSVIYEWDIGADRVVRSTGLRQIFGYTMEEISPTRTWWKERVHFSDRERVEAQLQAALDSGDDFLIEYRFRDRNGDYSEVDDRGKIVRGAEGRAVRVVGSMEDVSGRRQMERELRQAQKLEAVGRLGAGLAHEINTPIQFVGDSIGFLRDGFVGILRVLGLSRTLRAAAAQGNVGPGLIREIERAEEEADIEYLAEQIPQAIQRSLEGTSRVAQIVQAMKDFSHVDRSGRVPEDLNRALATTLIVAQNELKYVAEIETEFGDLPPIMCQLGDLNQVFLNLFTNAAHAIGEVVGTSGEKGRIRVRTRLEEDEAVVEISDTGTGIPESIRGRIFDPFFTSKEVGRGTGQGLSVSRSIVVDKHGGTIEFQSEVGRGTTFFIRLPVEPVLATKGGSR